MVLVDHKNRCHGPGFRVGQAFAANLVAYEVAYRLRPILVALLSKADSSFFSSEIPIRSTLSIASPGSFGNDVSADNQQDANILSEKVFFRKGKFFR